jgi:hypothetical protein
MAAAYGFHIAMNHPFRDGNKRTAFAAMTAFLRMNGWDFSMPDEEAAGLLLTMIESHRDKAWLADRLMNLCKPRSSFELRDLFAVLDHGEHYAHIVAFNQGSAEEKQASVTEAGRVMPVLPHLYLRAQHCDETNNREAASIFFAQVALLVAIYRIAEDLGYEW